MVNIQLNIPPVVADILARLEGAGHSAYAVGGALRDLIRGIPPHDWDIATSATPDEVAAVFVGENLIPTGIAHGTQTLVIDHIPYEITTYRTEEGYSDHRRPDSVHFVDSIEEDLARRDFTVNAMAYSPARGFCDPFDGRGDIERRLIRCVGEPDRRFEEDGLRILRALRFAAICDYRVEIETATSLHRCKELVRPVAAERIYTELNKLLCGASAAKMLAEFADVIAVIIPELEPCFSFEQRTPYHYLDVWAHTLGVLDATDRSDTVLRWAALLHDIGKPSCHRRDEKGRDHFKGHPKVSAEMSRAIFERLHSDKRTRDEVCFLIEHHDIDLPETTADLHRLLAAHGFERIERLLALKVCDAAAQAEYARTHGRASALPRVFADLEALKGTNVCLSVNDLTINGRDLLALGAKGKQIGELQAKSLDAVIDGTVENDRDALIEMAKRLLTEGF